MMHDCTLGETNVQRGNHIHPLRRDHIPIRGCGDTDEPYHATNLPDLLPKRGGERVYVLWHALVTGPASFESPTNGVRQARASSLPRLPKGESVQRAVLKPRAVFKRQARGDVAAPSAPFAQPHATQCQLLPGSHLAQACIFEAAHGPPLAVPRPRRGRADAGASHC